MAKMVHYGNSIIAAHTNGHTRRYEWKGLKKHPVLNRRMTLYECDRNTFAEIIKECKDNDVLSVFDESYKRDKGDCLEADAISIYIDFIGKVKFNKKTNVTATHSASEFKLRKLSICTIKTPLKNLKSNIKELCKSSNPIINKK